MSALWEWASWDAFSSIGTVGALVATAYTLVQARKDDRHRQATRVFLRPLPVDPERPDWKVEVVNASKWPITKVSLWGRIVIGSEVEWVDNRVAIVMLPDEKVTASVPHRPGFGRAPDQGGPVYAQFTDRDGVRWHVNQYGEINKGPAKENLDRRSSQRRWWEDDVEGV